MANPQRKHTLPDPPIGWISRNEAADLLDATPATFLYWEQRGYLHAQICHGRHTHHATHYYDPIELSKVPRKRNSLRNYTPPGEAAGRAFEMFEAGKTNRDVVIEMRVDPATVEDLRQQWLECGERIWVLSGPTRAELGEIVGHFTNERELVERVRASVAPTDATRVIAERP